MPHEWVSIVLKDSDAPAARVTRKAYEEIWKGKGFILEASAKKKEKE